METTQNSSDQLPSIIPSQIRREISNNRKRQPKDDLAKAAAVFSKQSPTLTELIRQMENLQEDQKMLQASLNKLKMKLVELDMNVTIEVYNQSQQIDELFKRIEALELAQKESLFPSPKASSPPPDGMYS